MRLARGATLTVVALLAGCAHTKGASATRPYPEPAAEALRATLLAHQGAVRSMNARVRATSWLGGERVRATVNMLVERDGHLRFEAEVSLQGTVATLATDGQRFALYDARKNELERGPACPENVASLVRIPLAPADVAAVLLGDGPAPPAADGGAVAWDAGQSADTLALALPAGGALRFFFRGTGDDRTVIAVERIGVDGQRAWRASYDDFAGGGPVRLPSLIRFAERDNSFDDGVEIRFKDRTLNAAAPAGAFQLSPPPGASVKEVGCGPP